MSETGQMPRVAFRTDASSQIGTGHVKRCGALAAALLDLGADVLLVDRDHGIATEPMLDARIRKVRLPSPQGAMPASSVPHAAWAGVGQAEDAEAFIDAVKDFTPDWVVVDHYAFDGHWHDAVRSALGCKILVIDDLADRSLSADIVVDHNLRADTRRFYQHRLTRPAKVLDGPRFALLGPAYVKAPRYSFRDGVESIGIFMGGSDFLSMSTVALDALDATGFVGSVEIATTSANPTLESLRIRASARPATSITIDQPDLAAFFARHDLQIGAGGGASWERCCIGVPTIATPWADNQKAVLEELSAAGAVTYVAKPLTAALTNAITQLIADPNLRRALATISCTLVDGRGAERVGLAMLANTMQVRPITAQQGRLMHAWRNAPETRLVSRDSQEIDLQSHLDWLEKSLVNAQRHILMGYVGQVPVGIVRFDQADSQSFEVSIYLDPGLHGLGLGVPLLLAGEAALAEYAPNAKTITADTLPKNGGSQAMFRRAGYAGETNFVKNISSVLGRQDDHKGSPAR